MIKQEIKWDKFDLGKNMPEDLIETSQNEKYKFQAEIVKKSTYFWRKVVWGL